MRIQSHGFASNPLPDSHHLGISPGGALDRIYLVGGEHPDRRQKNLPSGTAVLYDDKGNVVRAYGQDGIQVEAQQGHIWVKPFQAGKKVYLGGKPGDGGTYLPVMLSDGSPSSNVYAKK